MMLFLLIALFSFPAAHADPLFEKEFALAEIRSAEKNIALNAEDDFKPLAMSDNEEESRDFPHGVRAAEAFGPNHFAPDAAKPDPNAPRISIVDEMEKIIGASRRYEAAEEEERARR
ncbi:MAG: hypothetical protein EOP11_10220 [Proteobacteria bacterium]|nr:MAG: hypothetical protein EOP11_10220 [Pseudomonadota bacterium]